MLKVGDKQVHLSGGEIVAPVKGCRRNLPKGKGESSEEKIEVVLHGLPLVVDDWLRMVEALFSRIELGEQAVLCLKPAVNLPVYESRVISGRVELMGLGSMDLKRGGLGVALIIERENFWEGEEVTVPLSNLHGSDVVNGLVVDNQYHPAMGMVNHALIHGADILGEIPAPATVRIKNNDSKYLYTLGKIVVGQDVVYNLLEEDAWIEGSLGSSSLNYGAVSNSGASFGAYGLVQWSSMSVVEVVRFVLDNDRAARFGGRSVRPILRMFNVITTDDYWIRVKVKQGDAVEYSRWQKIVKYKKLQVLPAVHIPARDLRSSAMTAVIFVLELQRNVNETHLFTIDDIDLMPVDGYREYCNLGSDGLMWGETLVDDLRNDLIYSLGASSAYRALYHRAAGKGIWLMPGEDQVVRVKFDRTNGDCYPDHKVLLQMSYRPRRKNL